MSGRSDIPSQLDRRTLEQTLDQHRRRMDGIEQEDVIITATRRLFLTAADGSLVSLTPETLGGYPLQLGHAGW